MVIIMENTAFFTYKGYPLVRKGKEIYFGNMSDEYVCMMSIASSHKVKDLEVADKVKISLMRTAEGVDASQMITKNAERVGLYEALDLACVWLERK